MAYFSTYNNTNKNSSFNIRNKFIKIISKSNQSISSLAKSLIIYIFFTDF